MEAESAVMPDSRDGVGPTTECRGKSARRLHSPTPLPFPSLALLFANNNARRKIHNFNFCWFKSVTISSFYKQIGNRKVWFDFVFPPSCRQLSTSSTIYHSDLGRISRQLAPMLLPTVKTISLKLEHWAVIYLTHCKPNDLGILQNLFSFPCFWLSTGQCPACGLDNSIPSCRPLSLDTDWLND